MSEEQVNILILKHLEGLASTEENALLDAWLKEDDRHRQHFDQLRQVAEQLGQMDWRLELDREADWQKVKARLEEEKEPAGRIARLPWSRLARYAAAVAFLAAFGWLLYAWLKPQASPPVAERVVALRGETRQLNLPDGSTVRLNSDSYLSVPPSFGKGERRLQLSGEAYFEVAENARQPFIVDIGPANVRVLGTAFNLKAYSGSPLASLSVKEGSVRFSSVAAEGLEVQAGQAAEYDIPAAAFRRAPYDPETSLAWLEGRLVFKDTPLREVFLALERRYNVQIADQAGIGERLYSDTVNFQDPIDSFFQRLSLTQGISFRRDGGRAVLFRPE